MNVRERILVIRLIEKVNANPDAAEGVVTVEAASREENGWHSER